MNLLNLLPIIGKFFIGFYFAGVGFWNIYHWRPALRVLINKNIPLPFVVLPLGIFWEITAGTMIIFGSYVKLAALSLMIFTVIAITIYHDFWNHEGELRRLNMKVFLANLVISFGALLLLLNNITPITTFTDLFT
ncbi:MAG: DoxX family protein [Pseudomonadota bacterium]